jgi:hypothetical protein
VLAQCYLLLVCCVLQHCNTCAWHAGLLAAFASAETSVILKDTAGGYIVTQRAQGMNQLSPVFRRHPTHHSNSACQSARPSARSRPAPAALPASLCPLCLPPPLNAHSHRCPRYSITQSGNCCTGATGAPQRLPAKAAAALHQHDSEFGLVKFTKHHFSRMFTLQRCAHVTASSQHSQISSTAQTDSTQPGHAAG